MKKNYYCTFVILSNTIDCSKWVDWDGSTNYSYLTFQSEGTQVGGTSISSMQTASSLRFGFLNGDVSKFV
jgi:hypothetical protein